MKLSLVIVGLIVGLVIRQAKRGELDLRRLGRLAAVGAFAGLVIFFIFNAELVRQEANIPRFDLNTVFDLDGLMKAIKDLQRFLTTPDPRTAFMFTGFFAAMVGGLLVIADMNTALTRPAIARSLKKAILAALSGIVIGGTAGVLIDRLSTTLCRVSLLFIIVFQPLGWLLIGACSGLALGITLGSKKRLMACIVGGMIGGFIGGNLFETVGTITSLFLQNGTLGRLIGFPVMGAGIGASLAWIEDCAKKSWVTVLNGAKEGRQYILSKPITTIGRDELADIPLFGDMSVEKRHANLALQQYFVTLQSTGGEVAVNGANVQSKQLQPLDTIRIGRHLLRFHQKGERYAHSQQYAPQYQQQPYAPPSPPFPHDGYVPAQTMMQPMTSTGTLALVASSGPHAGMRVQFPPGAIRIGRESGHGIFLPLDTLVSRTHAEIAWTGAGWLIRDLGSRHGLWINGARVAEHVLNVGDQIGVGQTWLRVEAI